MDKEVDSVDLQFIMKFCKDFITFHRLESYFMNLKIVDVLYNVDLFYEF